MKYYRKDIANMLLGALYVQPTLFDHPKMAAVNEADFVDGLQKVSYAIMYNLYSMGHPKFSLGVIESYIQGRPQINTLFDEEIEIAEGKYARQGEYYFDKLSQVGDPTAFEPALDTIKKLTLLRSLEKNGVSVKQFYDWDTENQELIAYQQNWFEHTSLKDMANEISDNIQHIMDTSASNVASESIQAGEGLLNLIDSFKEAPDFGSPSPIAMMDTITRGDRLGKFYLYSAPTGNGKSRIMMSRACYSAFPVIYDQHKQAWVDNGEAEGSLFISTELDSEECQTMALAFLTGIPEDIILDGKFDEDQERVLREGARIMSEAPLYFEIISDFSVTEIEATIRKYYREHDVKYFRFDYIHTSMKFLAEIASISNGMKLREDQVLFMLSTKLKDLANQLGIFIESGTQVNGDYLEGELNQNLLRGSKAIADRIDVGMIAVKIRPIDEQAVETFVSQGYFRPNYIISFYKVRRGKYAGVKLWCDVDLGTCRCKGLFITDSNNIPIGIDATSIKVQKAAEKNVKRRNQTVDDRKSAF